MKIKSKQVEMELYLTNITLLDITKTSEVSSDVFVRVLVFNRQYQRRYSIASTAPAKAKQMLKKRVQNIRRLLRDL